MWRGDWDDDAWGMSRLSDASGLIAFALFFTSTDTAWSSSGKPGFKYGTSHKSRADGDMWVGAVGSLERKARRGGISLLTLGDWGGVVAKESWEFHPLPVKLGSWDIYIIYIYIYACVQPKRDVG